MSATQDITLTVKTDEEAVQRNVAGLIGWAIAGIAVVFSLFQLYQSGFGLMPAQNLRAVHLAFVLGLIFLLYPTLKSWDLSRMSIFDAALAAAAIAGPLYFYFNFNAMVMRAGAETATDLFMGVLTIAMLLEATRRAIGPVLPAIALGFMAYAYFGAYMPELFAHRGYSYERIVRHLYPTTEGVFGIPLAVASTFVFLFVLFGAVMQRTGISDYLTRVAMAGLGHYKGGPAKAAVLASAMMGSFSGSSTANVATTGTLTIPLMKRVGFRTESAGGVETAASASGQFIPPVMGAAVFVMVEITGIPYVEIIQAALLPAILDMLGILFCVHMHALKHKIHGLPREELPPILPTLMSQIYLLTPVIGLILMLTVARYTPTMSAFWAIPLALMVSLVARNTIIVWRAVRAQLRGADPFDGIQEAIDRQRSEKTSADEAKGEIRTYGHIVGKTWADWVKDFTKALEEGARQAIPISAACATAGIIIGIITLTGLGLRMQSILITLSGGELWAALVLTALGSIILGLGVPTTANYIIMATLMAPALIQLDVPVLAAHLFVFYFGILADVTPPVGLGAYVAAGIARSDPIKTSLEGFKFSITAFIIPFMFVYNPQLILQGDWGWIEVGWLVVSAAIGTYALAVMKEGWWLTRANVIERILMTFAAILLIEPTLFVDIAGFALMGAVYLFQMYKVRREAVHGLKEPTLTSRIVTGVGVLAVPAVAAWMFMPVVQVADEAGSAMSRTAFPGQTVVMSHIHSVEQTRVEDHFRLGWRGDMIHARTVTRSMGAGLPEGGAARGGVMTTRGTGERIRDLPLRFGPENEPLLRVNGNPIDISEFADERAFKLRTMFVWERIFGGAG